MRLDPGLRECSLLVHVAELTLGQEERMFLRVDSGSHERWGFTIASRVVALPQLVTEIGSQWNKRVHHRVVASRPGRKRDDEYEHAKPRNRPRPPCRPRR